MNVFEDSTFLALLAACRTKPDDDVPRVALSEWLQERDHPWGNFMQLQLEHHWRHQAFRERSRAEDEATLVRKQNSIEPSDEGESVDAEWRDKAVPELRLLWSQAVALKGPYWKEWALPPGQYDWKVNHLFDTDYDSARIAEGPRNRNAAFVSFRRGLLAQVLCPADVWFGSFCNLCDGRGQVTVDIPPTDEQGRFRYVPHDRCEGLGRLRGFGPLLAAHPVQELRMTDLIRPSRNGDDTFEIDLWDVPPEVIGRCLCLTGFDPRRRHTISKVRAGLVERELAVACLAWARDPLVIEKNSRQWWTVDRPISIGRPFRDPGLPLRPLV